MFIFCFVIIKIHDGKPLANTFYLLLQTAAKAGQILW